MTKFIVIASGKGGVGKTTTAINLGSALDKFGHKAIIIDGDLYKPNIGLNLGLAVTEHDLHDALKGKKPIKQRVYVHSSGLKMVPGDISLKALADLKMEKLRDVLLDLEGAAEIVIIDAATGLSRDTLSVIKTADEVIIVTNPELAAVTDALKLIKKTEEMGVKVAGVVVNRVTGSSVELPIKNIESMAGKKVIAVIPEDVNVKEAVKMKHPIVHSHPDSHASIAFKKLAAYILGERYEHSLSAKESKFEQFLKKTGFKAK